MPRSWSFVPERNAVQFVLAIFDDWEALCAVLVDMDADATMRLGAVLHAREDVPPRTATLRLLKEMAQLHFGPRQNVACTVGQLARELSSRVAKGARNLAEALHGWLSAEQARQLESHLERGHLVLCVQLRTPEEFSVLCGRLVQASPHMVELCNIKFETEHPSSGQDHQASGPLGGGAW
jgi:hypothetical protein